MYIGRRRKAKFVFVQPIARNMVHIGWHVRTCALHTVAEGNMDETVSMILD